MLSLTDKRVLDFYNTHKYIDFETANILLVEMLERLLQKGDDNRDDILLTYLKKIDNGFGTLTNSLTDVKENVKQSSLSIVNLQTSVANIPTSMTDNLTSKLNVIRENQVRELERIFDSNKNNNIEHIDKAIKSDLVEQIRNLFDTNMNTKIEKSLNNFEKTLREEWNSSLKQLDKTDSPQTIIDSFNKNLQVKCDSLQQFIQSCHDKINNTTSSHSETLSLVQTHFDRQKNSTFKGKDSENRVEEGLNNAFPECQIVNTTGISKAGDFLIERADKTPIMIENKDYKANVPKEEIEKFIRDIEEQELNGILISQNSGISRKKNFQIDLHNGKIVVFIHHLDYNFENVRLAVESIDHLSNFLKDYVKDSVDFKLSNDVLKKINQEYLAFNTQKSGLIESLKKHNKDMTVILTEMQFPELANILSRQFASTEQTLFKCQYCKVKVYKNAKGLAKHVETCKKIYEKQQKECITIETDIMDTGSD